MFSRFTTRMRQLALLGAVALTSLAVPTPALASSCTSQTIGSFTYTDCSDGSRATSQRIGSFDYTDITPPPSSSYQPSRSCTTQRIGSFDYTNCYP